MIYSCCVFISFTRSRRLESRSDEGVTESILMLAVKPFSRWFKNLSDLGLGSIGTGAIGKVFK